MSNWSTPSSGGWTLHDPCRALYVALRILYVRPLSALCLPFICPLCVHAG